MKGIRDREPVVVKSLLELIDADDGRPDEFDDPLVSALVAEILLLAEEVCVARDSLAALETGASGAGEEIKAETRLAEHAAFYTEICERLAETIEPARTPVGAR